MGFCSVGARINAWEILHRRELVNDMPEELSSGHMRAIMGFQTEFDGHSKRCKQCAVAFETAFETHRICSKFHSKTNTPEKKNDKRDGNADAKSRASGNS